MITKMHFERAAAIVKSVLHDEYGFHQCHSGVYRMGAGIRAVRTAEYFPRKL